MGVKVDFSQLRAFDQNGDPVAGALAYFYAVGTTTPVTVYTASDNMTAHPSPLVADAAGVFPAVWARGEVKVNVTTALGATVPGYPQDPAMSVAYGAAGAKTFTFATLAEFRADTELTYTAGLENTVVPGDYIIIHQEGLSFTVAPSGSTTNATATAGGVKVNIAGSTVTPAMFGADGVNDQASIQAAWDYAALHPELGPVQMRGVSTVEGQLTLDSGAHVQWSQGSWLKQTDFSATGSFVQTLDPNSSSAASIKSGILLENPQIDGELFPAPVALIVASSTATTVTFTAAASSVDGFYNGMCLEDTTAANGGGLRIVTAYVGATRTATHTTPWVSNPTATTVILAGWNDNGIGLAAGITNATIRGGVVKNYPGNLQVPSGNGGKGVDVEQGATDILIDGGSFENVDSAVFIQGIDGVMANGAKKRAVGVRVSNIHAKNAGAATVVAGINADASPDGDSDDSMIVISGVTYENAGHAPWRLVLTDPQKSGVHVMAEAQNVSYANIRGRNDATYPNLSPGYPTDYPKRCGFGLTGDVGALFWGHGRNLVGSNIVHHGNLDALFSVRRARAKGEDAGPTGAPRNCFGWDFRQIKHHGVLNRYVIEVDPTALLRVDPTELTGQIECVVDAVTLGICDPNMSAFTGFTLDVTERGTGKRIIGTIGAIILRGNTFASYPQGLTDLRVADRRTYTMANDTAVNFTPLAVSGLIEIYSLTSQLVNTVRYRADPTTPQTALYLATSLTGVTTGILSGTTGGAGDFTISAHTDGKIYLQNRRGGSVTVDLVIPVH